MKEFRNTKGQKIGEMSNQVFRKRVKLSKHLLKMMDAWGIDQKVIKQLEPLRCKEIRILEEEKNEIYSITFDGFKLASVVRDFGDSPQLFVSRKYFNKEKYEQ